LVPSHQASKKRLLPRLDSNQEPFG
jgi:hypothetical protein